MFELNHHFLLNHCNPYILLTLPLPSAAFFRLFLLHLMYQLNRLNLKCLLNLKFHLHLKILKILKFGLYHYHLLKHLNRYNHLNLMFLIIDLLN